MEKQNAVFLFIKLILLVIGAGIIGAGISAASLRGSYTGELADARQLSEQYRSELDRATERIGSLEASNSRLNEHLRSASRNIERLEDLTGQTISDSRAARAIVAEITVQVKALIGELDNWRSGGDSGDGHNNMADL